VPPAPPIEVEFQITREDLFAFQWRAATWRRMRLAGSDLAMLAAALVVMGLLTNGRDAFRLGWVSVLINMSGALVFVATVAVVLAYMNRRSARRALRAMIDDEKADGGSLGTHRIVLTEQELIETTAVAESRRAWTGMDRVEQDDGYVFIYTGPHAAHIVPKRAFADAAGATRFYETAKQLLEAARRA